VTGPSLAYALLAAGLSTLALVQSFIDEMGVGPTIAALLGTAAVAIAARAPFAVALLAAGSAAAQSALGAPEPSFASFLVLMATAYALGRRATTTLLAAGLAVLAAGIGAVVAGDPTLQTPGEAVYPVVYLGGATTLGRLVRSRERASRAALRAAEREAEAREQEALAEERARIAREMHDVVAHSISLLVVQAEAAAAVLSLDPARARQQLERISGSGRQALTELRRILDVLRLTGEPDDAQPQPGLRDLPTLSDTFRDVGRDVQLCVDGPVEDLPPGLQLTAYRLVQEALTNAVRHGHASQVRVRLRCADGLLSVDVEDDGTGPSAHRSPGHGLQGMQERVRLYDGELETGPAAGSGFRVAARLPVAL
jgi:signal transduction histidine kinase